jgi:hypothetical protein
MSKRHDSVIRLVLPAADGVTAPAGPIEELLGRSTDSYSLLSAHSQGRHTELTYGIRPRRGTTALEVLTAVGAMDTVADAELFDTKHQVEF